MEAMRMMRQAKRIVLFTHIAPDGDAMGSSLAMYHWLRTREQWSLPPDVTLITPNTFPPFLAWMPGADQILVYENNEPQAKKIIAEADLHICLDFNEPKRIGPVGDRILLNPCPKLLIDHHLNPSAFATLMFSHPEASSTCELVFRLLWQTSHAIPSLEIATCLYTGLMTDTGNFAFNSNNPDIYEMIAELVRVGINKDAIYNDVFNQYSADRMRLMGYCLYRKMKIYPDFHLSLIALSEEELKQFNFVAGDAEGIVNLPLQIKDIYYSVLMREQPPKPGTPKPVIKISFRSQGDRPVNIMAHDVFGGGGHMNASGGEMYGSLAQAVQRFEQKFPNYLKKD